VRRNNCSTRWHRCVGGDDPCHCSVHRITMHALDCAWVPPLCGNHCALMAVVTIVVAAPALRIGCSCNGCHEGRRSATTAVSATNGGCRCCHSLQKAGTSKRIQTFSVLDVGAAVAASCCFLLHLDEPRAQLIQADGQGLHTPPLQHKSCV